MATHGLRLTEPRPFFAEVPYYLWGQVNYNSEGDCKSPTDRQWTWLDLTNRETREHLDVNSQGDTWEVAGDDPLAARAAHFLAARCRGEWIGPAPMKLLQGWDHDRAAGRAVRVQEEFERPELRPFDVGHLFWGSWKWVGWFGTEFTWVGRWIMHSVVTGDTRAVNLCVYWLREGTVSEQQSQALRYALHSLTLRLGSGVGRVVRRQRRDSGVPRARHRPMVRRPKGAGGHRRTWPCSRRRGVKRVW
jgi:hypothetical protein